LWTWDRALKTFSTKISISKDLSFFVLKKSKCKNRSKNKRTNIFVTLFGDEESQVIPVWPHKSLETSQDKLPFEVNEL